VGGSKVTITGAIFNSQQATTNSQISEWEVPMKFAKSSSIKKLSISFYYLCDMAYFYVSHNARKDMSQPHNFARKLGGTGQEKQSSECYLSGRIPFGSHDAYAVLGKQQ
jgi:hypothetical protein